MNFSKSDYDKLKALSIEKEVSGSNGKMLSLGLSAMAIGGLAIPFASVPIGIGALALGGLTAMASFINKNDMAITEDMPLYSELVPKEEIFEYLNLKNSFDEKPKFRGVEVIGKQVAFAYDLPFGFVDDDFVPHKTKIAKLLGCESVLIEIEGNTLYIKNKSSNVIPQQDLFEHLSIKNIYDERPKFRDTQVVEKSITYIYDVPFGLIDEDFEEYQDRIAKMLGCDKVELDLKGGKLYIKHKEKVEFKEFYQYKPLYFPKTENFNVLVGMVEQDGEIVPYTFDFSVEPHMLLAGVTGKGKSTLLNCMIINLMLNYTPQELKLYLIDFKGGVEFSCFEKCKHVKEVIWEKDKLAKCLKWLENDEIPRRERLLKSTGNKNIFGYNESSIDGLKLPFMLFVLDEFAQLSPTEDKDIIDQLIRLTPKIRFLGIYFIIATQRPSSNILTNDIKTNLTNVVGLAVNSIHDTKVIFSENEVELHKLKGKGKGYLRTNGEYKYFNGFYLGVNPTDRSEQERTIKQLLTEYDLYK